MPPYYPYVHPPEPPRKNEGKAIAALVLGILSVSCLGIFAGIPAIVLGALARRDIDRAQGALGGARLAAGGIVTGLFGTGLSLVLAVAVLGGVVEAAKQQKPEPRTEAPLRVPVAAGTRSYGTLDVVDLDGERPLKSQLSEVARGAAAKGRTVLLQTYVRSSPECAAVAAALPDGLMQHALANVTLIRVDIDSFEDELRGMRVEVSSAPWFYKLDATARPTDAISADEWDANIAENMAPILGNFVRGTLGSRRNPSPLGTEL